VIIAIGAGGYLWRPLTVVQRAAVVAVGALLLFAGAR
jgi:hypothetical protein